MFEFKDCTDGRKDDQAKPVLRYRTVADTAAVKFQVYDEADGKWYDVAVVCATGLIKSDAWHGWRMGIKGNGQQSLAEPI